MDDAALHVTLSFLGEVAEEAVPGLVERLAPCAAPARGLELGAGRWLPPRRPRVLAVEVEDSAGELGALRAAVARAVADPSSRPWLAHVTVARARGTVEPFAPPEAPGGGFDAAALTLYRSRPGGGVARYDALWSANLVGFQ